MYSILRNSVREIRGGLRSFRVFLTCLALGAMALSAISSIKKSINVGLTEKSVEVLGGDISIKLTYRFANDSELNFFSTKSESFSEVTDFRSMASVVKDGKTLDSSLIRVKGVDNRYPLYGEIKLTPEIPLHDALIEINDVFGVVAEQSLLERLNLRIGDNVKIGNNFFEIRAEILREPDAGSNSFSFAPRVITFTEGLIKSGLLGSGTMFDTNYRLLAPDVTLEDIKSQAKFLFGENGMRWKDSSNATPGVDRFINRLTAFLLLVGMAGMAIGGVGVALSVSMYLETKKGTIAILKTLGATNSMIFGIYFLIILFLAIVGSVFGACLGALIPIILEPIIISKFPIPISFNFYISPMLEAVFYGVLTAVIFSLWPLGLMLNNNVTSLLRNFINQTKLFPSLIYQIFTVVCLLLLVTSFSLRSPNPLISLGVFLGIALSLFALLTMAIIIKIFCRVISRTKVLLKTPKIHLALSSLGGPNNEIALTMLSVGLGLIVLATIGQIDYNLRKNVSTDIADRAPTFFLIDIQPSQLIPLKNMIISSEQVTQFSSAPMLRGIITKINGNPVKESVGDHWAIRGDRGLTYAEAPPEDSIIVEGEWWSQNYTGKPLISFSKKEAQEMGLSLGDEITVNVLGRDLVGTIKNFRDVDFATMRINFLMVFNPSALEAAPHSHIATIYSNEKSEVMLQRKIRSEYPNITAISMRNTLSQVSETLGTIAAITRWSSLITILIGLVVLVGVAAATEKRRSYEACLLKTLGASNQKILSIFTIRSSLVGAGAGIMAIIVSNLAAWAIITGFMDLQFSMELRTVLIIIASGILTNVTAGLIFALGPLSTKISQILRYND